VAAIPSVSVAAVLPDGGPPGSIEASSGRTVRHRLNRGRDRALNRAIYTIAATRMRCCSSTQRAW
jgi:hypothetical protein